MPVYKHGEGASKLPSIGVAGILRFNSSATLTVPILGSMKTIRDSAEGPSLLDPIIQDAIMVKSDRSGAVLSRLWLDNAMTSELALYPFQGMTIRSWLSKTRR